MVKAKEALAAANLDVDGALAWLEKDLAAGGAAKQAKLAGRTTKEGLIAVGVIGEGWGRRGGILEVRRRARQLLAGPDLGPLPPSGADDLQLIAL